jgi:hypothetical protein
MSNSAANSSGPSAANAQRNKGCDDSFFEKPDWDVLRWTRRVRRASQRPKSKKFNDFKGLRAFTQT